MSESPSELHEFHLTLCRYAAGEVAEYLHVLRVPQEHLARYAVLYEYLRQLESQGQRIGPNMSDLLLNDHEFSVLQGWAETMEVAIGGRPIPTNELPRWQPLYHGRALDCTQELKSELSPEWAGRWLADSRRYADQLEEDGLSIAEGVRIVRYWAIEARRYLNAMGKVAFLPRPDGDYPTPTTIAFQRHPQSKVSSYRERLDAASISKQYKAIMDEALGSCQPDEVQQLAQHERIISFVETMQWAIRSNGDAPGATLIRRVSDHNAANPNEKKAANRELSFLALRILKCLGEHTPGEDKAKRRR